MRTAVPEGRVPEAPECRTSEASSCGLRALASSSTGSTPTRRNSQFADPFVTQMIGVDNVVKNLWAGVTHSDTRRG